MLIKQDKQGIHLSDDFIESVKTKYDAEIYTENNGIKIVVRKEGSTPLIFSITDIDQFNFSLFLYINNLNHYYLSILKQDFNISIKEILISVFDRLMSTGDGDITLYVTNLTNKIKTAIENNDKNALANLTNKNSEFEHKKR